MHRLLLGEAKASEAIGGTQEGADLLPVTIELATAEQPF